MLTDELITAGAEEAAHHEGNDQDVVELADDGNEIGHEIEGEREIRDERREQQLAAPRHAVVGHQSRDQDDAVRDEAGKGARVLAAPDRRERNHEGKPDEHKRGERECKPQPPRHEPTLQED